MARPDQAWHRCEAWYEDAASPTQDLRRSVLSAAGLAILVGTILLVQHLSLRPPTTTASIPPGQKPALPLPDIPSIAVLPFTNLSGDPAQEYFSDGTNDLITELGVKYVLEGGVQREGERVRISAQLVDATTGAELWAERYDRPMKDIFSLQDEIVSRIVTTVNLQLSLWQKQGLLIRNRTQDMEAYDDLLREA